MLQFGVRLEPKGVQRFGQKLQRYIDSVRTQSRNGVQEAADMYCQIVISHMGEHTGNEMVFSDTWWKALSEKWLNIKKSQGLVEEIWEATGETKGYVQVHSAQKTADGWSIFAGLQGVPLDVLRKALENEFGSEVLESTGMTMHIVPARPLFEPAKWEILHSPAHRRMLVTFFAKALKRGYEVYAHGR